MLSSESKGNFDHFLSQRNTLFVRGLILSIAGIILTTLSVLVPDVRIMNQNSAWLPIVALVILGTGILACFDAGADDFLRQLAMVPAWAFIRYGQAGDPGRGIP